MAEERRMHPIKKGHFSAHFIRYIPAPWLQKACALEGRDTVKVAMVVWLLWSQKQGKDKQGDPKTNNPNIVWANNWMFSQFHVAPRSASRALRVSKANLISFVKGGPGTVGQRPVVRLLFVKTVKKRISRLIGTQVTMNG